MDENLVGYLLDALDPADRRKVDQYLQKSPEAQRRLDVLRRALAPLAADRDVGEPPAGLAVRTLARVAEYRCRELPPAPRVVSRPAVPVRWWRRADVLAAAGIFLCAVLLVPPGLHKARFQRDRIACQNNLRVLGQALLRYADGHDEAFPDLTHPSADPRRQPLAEGRPYPAGVFVPALLDAGVLDPEDVSVRCPGNGGRMRCERTLAEIDAMSDDQLDGCAPRLVPCYAYNLGYHDGQPIVGLRRDGDVLPLAGDAPPFPCTAGNSRNHGGAGQNVLFTDGHVGWLVGRVFGGDDFFVNEANQPKAGIHRGDNVLGASGTRP